MGIELRLPNITGTEQEQLAQIRSYLYQFIPQLQWALNTMETTEKNNYVVNHSAQRVSSNGSSSFDAGVAFSALKPLIIKSADIVEAYYEEINKKLSGAYVAQSDFGTFMEKTESDITATSTYVDQKYSDVQVIITDKVDGLKVTFQEDMDTLNSSFNSSIGDLNDDIERLNVAIIEANAYIRSGLLYYDENETPVYGLEVGQRNTVNGEEVVNKYARFTSDRLSFYDQNGSEVAYISDYKLFIRNAEITSSLKIGGFVDTVMSNEDIVTKWVGGEG